MNLIKTSNVETDFVLLVAINTEKGYIKFKRYYDNEFILYNAYYQLKKIKCKMIPICPVIFGEEIYI